MWGLNLHEFECVQGIFEELEINFDYPYESYQTDTARGDTARVNVFYSVADKDTYGGQGIFPDDIVEGIIFDDTVLGFNKTSGALNIASVVEHDEPLTVYNLKVATLLRYILSRENRVKNAIALALFDYVLLRHPQVRTMRHSASLILPDDNINPVVRMKLQLQVSRRTSPTTILISYRPIDETIAIEPRDNNPSIIGQRQLFKIHNRTYMTELLGRLLNMLGYIPRLPAKTNVE